VAPLSIAAQHGHIVITKKLLAAGADVNAQSEVRIPSHRVYRAG
jgi:ankyrin repeat protein